MNVTLSLGISPCPNDTFMFDAMIHGKIDTEGLSFDVVLTDVEDLNRKAFQETFDVTKLSFHALFYLSGTYILLDAGSALGKGCGPLLISQSSVFDIESSVAIPGQYTTANFLLNYYAPQVKNKVVMVFSEIEQAVLEERVSAGVIIHENRFTYAQKGLKKIADLGEYWENTTGAPIPLGGIVARRSLPDIVREKLNRVMCKSVEFALAHPSDTMEFVRQHAQEMSEEVMRQHIALYVNEYSVCLGEEGRRAIGLLFEKAETSAVMPVVKHRLPVFQK